MGNMRMLLFRRGGEKYGVPVEDVIGVAGSGWMNKSIMTEYIKTTINLQEKPTSIREIGSGFEGEENKFSVMIESDGIHITIVVDEVIEVIEMPSGEMLSGAMMATFKIWSFKK